MDTKHCSDCGATNMRGAKFCLECRFEFPDFSTTARTTSISAPKIVRKPVIQEAIEEDGEELEMPADLVEPDMEMSNILVGYLEKDGKLRSNRNSVKLIDAIGNEKPGQKTRRKPMLPLPKTDKAAIKMGRDILRSTANRRNPTE